MTTALVWLRRDLRLSDHAALSAALQAHTRVVPVFVFDPALLTPLPRDDRRVSFIHACLRELQQTLQGWGSDLRVRHADPRQAIPALAAELGAVAVYANRDYEPAAIERDRKVADALTDIGVIWCESKDQVIFERDEIRTGQGTPFQVFTPYWRQWQARLNDFELAEHPVSLYRTHFARLPATELPSLSELGFAPAPCDWPAGETGAAALLADFLPRLANYAQERDLPARPGTSRLSPHLRFGTLSVRQLARLAVRDGSPGAQTWLKELAWREFYQQLLWHHPALVEHSFRLQFDRLPFPNRPDWFAAWRAGQTGYPLVDAGMRQLLQTGWMHNRLRMLCASFLVKDLLIDWRWGEQHFAVQLLDFDLASNNGGWQWAASVGCDAQPWFRIFNPVTQSQKFDPNGRFIRQYCPELAALPTAALHAPWLASPDTLRAAGIELDRDYPLPLVDHARQRQAALALFRAASEK
jgi:deoxyribodipyrimidine photo-lyase